MSAITRPSTRWHPLHLEKRRVLMAKKLCTYTYIFIYLYIYIQTNTRAHVQCKVLKVSCKTSLTRQLSVDMYCSRRRVTSWTWPNTYHRSRKALASWSLLSRGQKGASLGPLLHTIRRTPGWPDGTSLAVVPRTSRYRDKLDTSHPDIHIHMPYKNTKPIISVSLKLGG